MPTPEEIERLREKLAGPVATLEPTGLSDEDRDLLSKKLAGEPTGLSSDDQDLLRRKLAGEITPAPTSPETGAPPQEPGGGGATPEELAAQVIARQGAAPPEVDLEPTGKPSLLDRAGNLAARLGTRGIEIPVVTPALRRGTDEVFQALEAFSEETFRGLTFQDPASKSFNPATAINEASAALRERPLAAQIGIGLIDPAIGISRLPGSLGRVTLQSTVGPGLLGNFKRPIIRQLDPSQIPPSLRSGTDVPIPAKSQLALPPASGRTATGAIEAPGRVGAIADNESRLLGDRGTRITRLPLPSHVDDAAVLQIDRPDKSTWTVTLNKESRGSIQASILPNNIQGEVQPFLAPEGIQPLGFQAFPPSEIRAMLREISLLFPDATEIRGIRETVGRTRQAMQSFPLVPTRPVLGPVRPPTPVSRPTLVKRPGTASVQRALPSAVEEIVDAVEESARAVDAAFPNTSGVIKSMSPEVEASIAKLTGLAEEARPAQQEALRIGLENRSIERSRRVGELRARERTFRAEGLSSQEANRRATAALRGELPGPEFTPLQFTPGEFKGLFDHVLNINQLLDFQRINARVALEKTLAGIPVAPADKKLLSEIFGTPFANALAQPPSLIKKGLDISLDALNLPRTILTSFDVSAPLRQGVVLLPDHPGRWSESVVSMMKAFAREGSAQVVDDAIRADPNFARFTARHPRGNNSNLFIADTTTKRGLGQQEELYMSRFAQKIPGIKQSQRAYVTFLNKLRFDVMSDIVREAEEAGVRVASQDLDELALFLNRATGRGSLGKNLDSIAPALNVAMFAPKLLMSRLQLPLSVGSKSALVRKQARRTLLKFVGTGVGLLSLLSFSTGAKVETDPRSSDFGKIRIGNSSMDIWGGFQPIARYVAQLSTGKGKIIAGPRRGEIRDLERFSLKSWQEPVWLRFVRSKLSPIGSAAFDPTLGGGETFVGDPVLGDPESSLQSRAARVAFERLVPLFWQDVVDGIKDDGVVGALKALPAVLGVGVTTFDREGR